MGGERLRVHPAHLVSPAALDVVRIAQLCRDGMGGLRMPGDPRDEPAALIEAVAIVLAAARAREEDA